MARRSRDDHPTEPVPTAPLPRVAEVEGGAHDPTVVTESREDVATAAHLAPDTVLQADLSIEREQRLDGAKSKVRKLQGHLTAAQEELGRLEKEGN